MTISSPPEPAWRRVLRLVHLWLGVGLLIPFIVLGVTGSVLVFHHEIDDLTRAAELRVEPGGHVRPMSELVGAAAAAVPRDYAPTLVVIPERGDVPATVRFVRQGGQPQGPADGRQIVLDPATLRILGADQVAASGFLRVMHRLHGSLLIGGGTGRTIVGWLGVAMLILGCSGLVMWWPARQQWREAFTVTRGASRYRWFRELHGALGIWSWPVFIVVSFSGVYIAFPQPVGELIRAVFPGRDVRVSPGTPRVEPIADVQPIGVDAAVALALTAAPDTRLWTVRFPTRPDHPYRLGLIRAGHEHGQPAVSVAVDPWRGSVVDILDPRDFTVGETMTAWQRGLHAGEGLGWVWKSLVFLSGLLPAAFGITGCAMWLAQRRAGRRINRLTEVPQA